MSDNPSPGLAADPSPEILDSSHYFPTDPFMHLSNFIKGEGMPIFHKGIDLRRLFMVGDTTEEAINYRVQILNAWFKYLSIEDTKHTRTNKDADIATQKEKIQSLISSRLDISNYDAWVLFDKASDFITLGYLQSQRLRNELFPLLLALSSVPDAEVMLIILAGKSKRWTLSTSP